MTNPPPSRRPYKGSCHCGLVTYIAHLTLPPAHPTADRTIALPESTVRIRKCNCSTCHKMSFFHVRVPDSPNDFVLLSPLTERGEKAAGEKGGINVGEGGLREYTCFDGNIHWYFCSRCGVRCFAFMGEGEVRDTDVGGDRVRAWTPKREGWKEGLRNGCYLSVNAGTVEAGQEGWDMREWHEKGWIVYLDEWKGVEEDRVGRPCEGGMY